MELTNATLDLIFYGMGALVLVAFGLEVWGWD